MFGIFNWAKLAVYGAVFLAGMAVSSFIVYPVATMKERAAWAEPVKELADAQLAQNQAQSEAWIKETARLTRELTALTEKNSLTRASVSEVLTKIGGLNREISTVKAKIITVPVGNCSFTVDADLLRQLAYETAVGASRPSGNTKARQATGADEASGSASGSGKPGPAPLTGTGTEGD